MSNATKSLAIIFAVLVVITGLVKWSSGPAESEALRKGLATFDTTAVDKIVIDRPTNDPSILLTRSKNVWNVEQDREESGVYPAASGKISRAMQELKNMEILAVVSRNESEYPRFKVDSTGTRVSLYDGAEQLESVILGAPQMESRRQFNNYVRPADEEAVYTVSGFVSSTFNQDWDAWRNKKVWNLNRQDLQHVEFDYPADSSYTVTKATPNSWVAGNDTVNTSVMATVVDKLSRLNAKGFEQDVTKETFGEPLYTLRLQLTNGDQKNIELRPNPNNNNEYIGRTDDFPYIFTLDKNSWDNQVLKPRRELLR